MNLSYTVRQLLKIQFVLLVGTFLGLLFGWTASPKTQEVEKNRPVLWTLGSIKPIDWGQGVIISVVDTPGACFYIFHQARDTRVIVREVKRSEIPAGKGCQ